MTLGLPFGGANDTVFAGLGVTGGGFGSGGSITGAFGGGSISGLGAGAGSVAGLAAGPGAGAGEATGFGGPGKDTRLTLMAPCPSLGLGVGSGK